MSLFFTSMKEMRSPEDPVIKRRSITVMPEMKMKAADAIRNLFIMSILEMNCRAAAVMGRLPIPTLQNVMKRRIV